MEPSVLILAYLIYSEEYIRRVAIHLKSEYFDDPSERRVFEVINSHFLKYNQIPDREETLLQVSELKISDGELEKSIDLINAIYDHDCSKMTFEFMWDKAEDYCQDRSLFNALAQSLEISKEDSQSIPAKPR